MAPSRRRRSPFALPPAETVKRDRQLVKDALESCIARKRIDRANELELCMRNLAHDKRGRVSTALDTRIHRTAVSYWASKNRTRRRWRR